MSKVMVFTIHNTEKWWAYLAANLKFASKTVILSDLPYADICLMPRFYELLRTTDAARLALDALGEEACAEIIQRDRILRKLERTLALRMIGAMWTTFDEIAEKEAPDLFMSFCVDRYILDIIERVLRKRGIPYLGLVVSPVPEHIMFMAKGEYVPVREPSEAEIGQAAAILAAPKFVPELLKYRVPET